MEKLDALSEGEIEDLKKYCLERQEFDIYL